MNSIVWFLTLLPLITSVAALFVLTKADSSICGHPHPQQVIALEPSGGVTLQLGHGEPYY